MKKAVKVNEKVSVLVLVLASAIRSPRDQMCTF